jgi:superfamily II DNA or RNA helicase
VLIQIAHNAVNAKLLTENKELKYTLSELLSYQVSGYENMSNFQNGNWDGRSSFFNFKKSTFPAGFVLMVKSKFEQMGHQVQIIRPKVPEPIGDPEMKVDSFGRTPEYEYQYECVERLLKQHQMIARLATGAGKSRCAMLATSRIGRKTLFLTTRKSLMYQMKKHYEEMGADVGVIGDSVMNVKPFVNVGMVQTIAANLKSRTIQEEVVRLKELEHNKFEKLIAEKDKILTKQLKLGHITLQTKFKILSDFKKELNSKTKDLAVLQRAATINCKIMNRKKAEMEKLLSTFEFVIAEEAHESGGNEYFEVMQYCTNAHYRLALTATPFMKDDEEANMRLMACSGIIGIVVTEKELIDKGILAKPYFMFINNARPTGVFPTTNYVSAYEKGIVKNNIRNDEIVKWSKWSTDRNLPVLILVNRTEHGNILKDLIQKQGLKCNFIYGKDEDEVRQENLKKLESGEINVLIGTNILDVGVDVPSIGMVILAAGGKAEVQLRQRIGRGLRRKKTGKNITYIIDFQDSFNQHLLKHAKTRQEIIKNTPGFAEGIVPTFCFN